VRFPSYSLVQKWWAKGDPQDARTKAMPDLSVVLFGFSHLQKCFLMPRIFFCDVVNVTIFFLPHFFLSPGTRFDFFRSSKKKNLVEKKDCFLTIHQEKNKLKKIIIIFWGSLVQAVSKGLIAPIFLNFRVTSKSREIKTRNKIARSSRDLSA